MLLLFCEKLRISREFIYKTIERGYDLEAVNRLLGKVVELTNVPIQGLEKVFSVDGTGMPSSRKENNADERARQNSEGREAGAWPGSSREGTRRPMIGVGRLGVRFQLYTGWIGSGDRRNGETSVFPQLLVRAQEMHSGMDRVVGDGAYAGRPRCALVAAVGAVPRFLPRRNATMKGEGVRAWTEMLLSMAEKPQQWFREYDEREASECGFTMVKNRKGALRKRLDRRKEAETYLRFVQHNVTRLA